MLEGGGSGAVVSELLVSVCRGAGLGARPHVLSCWKVGISRPVTRVYNAPMGPPRSSHESWFVVAPSRNAFAYRIVLRYDVSDETRRNCTSTRANSQKCSVSSLCKF